MESGDSPSPADVDKAVRDAYSLEYRATINTEWSSAVDQRIAVKAAKDCRDSAQDLLKQEQDDRPEMAAMPEDKRRIAEEYWGYVRTSLRNSVQAIHNMQVRREYIGKIKNNAAEFRGKLNAAVDSTAKEELARAASAARNLEREVARARLTPSANSFSKMLKAKGITFDQLLEKYAKESFSKKFSELPNSDKATVYAVIIDSSGRSNKISNYLARAQGVVGVATILFMLATFAWDVVESENPVAEAVKGIWVSGSALVAGFTAEMLANEVSAALTVELSETAAAAIGLISGVMEGFIFGMIAATAAEALFDILLSAFTLDIPNVLRTQTFVPIMVPTGSPVSEYLAAKVAS